MDKYSSTTRGPIDFQGHLIDTEIQRFWIRPILVTQLWVWDAGYLTFLGQLLLWISQV